MTTVLHERAQEYLRLRRALGFRLRREGDILPQFAGYLEQHGAAAVTAEHAIAWAQLPQGVHPVTWSHRLSAVRGFAAWLRTVDPATEIPPRGVFPGQGKRPVPFIFTGGQLAAVVAGCAVLRPAMRSARSPANSSGQRVSHEFRWAADPHLRDAWCDWAADTRSASPWAAEVYERAREAGKRHPHAARILACAWIRVVWPCRQAGIPYDPDRHRALQAALARQAAARAAAGAGGAR